MIKTKNKSKIEEEMKEENIEEIDFEEETEKLKEKNDKLNEQNNHLIADYQNLERRFSQEKEQLVRLANLGFVQSILDDLDHMKMAEANLKNKDLTMVMKKFRETLKNLGLEEIKAIGKEFDPKSMEVIKKNGEGNKVLQIAQNGFKLNGQVIRFVKVIVG
jgi:molecular chaperone GrpE